MLDRVAHALTLLGPQAVDRIVFGENPASDRSAIQGRSLQMNQGALELLSSVFDGTHSTHSRIGTIHEMAAPLPEQVREDMRRVLRAGTRALEDHVVKLFLKAFDVDWFCTKVIEMAMARRMTAHEFRQILGSGSIPHKCEIPFFRDYSEYRFEELKLVDSEHSKAFRQRIGGLSTSARENVLSAVEIFSDIESKLFEGEPDLGNQRRLYGFAANVLGVH
jgi:hypothetical protein